MNKITKLIIPAAGLGTRLLPASKAMPKEMIPVLDKPTLHYIIEEAVKSGIEEVFLITNSYKRSIEDHFDRSYELEDTLLKRGKLKELEIVQNISKMVKIYYVRQDEPKGNAYAISLSKTFIKEDEHFALMFGDDILYSDKKPVLAQAIDIYREKKCNIISVFPVEKKLVSKFGIVEVEENTLKILDVVEKPKIEEAKSNLISTGPYILSSNIFNSIDKIKPGNSGELQITDAMKDLMKIEDFYANKFDGKFYSTGDKLGLMIANIDFALRDEEISDKIKEYIRNLNL
ncbi:MAG: UTP--glucose-1-phosphate uridylyltransferase [Bacilli bacterium]